MSPPWLERVLSDRAFVDLGTVAGRELMAEAILAAIPKAAIAAAIHESACAVLIQKRVLPAGENVNGLARELGNNSAQSVLCVLEDPSDEVDIPF